jgi:hypothetical protein
MDLLRRRLYSQRLAGEKRARPEDVVGWLGAVQSQEYPAAKWSIGERLKTGTDAAVERAFASGAILRTHILRPTWHFVTPADIRWMLQLTSPRVHATNAYFYRRLEVDESVAQRGRTVITRALRGGKALTRPELTRVIREAGVQGDPQRVTAVLMRAELDGLICSGPRQGLQHTYMLLDERAPQAKTLPRDEALAELTSRFFLSHGPATIQDFVWWSSLTAADARAGLEMAKHGLESGTTDGQVYWGPPVSSPLRAPRQAYLLPDYDEYIVAYKDRMAMLGETGAERYGSWHYGSWPHTPIVLDGRTLGSWRRTIEKGAVVVAAKLLAPIAPAHVKAVRAAAERYGRFLAMPATLITV